MSHGPAETSGDSPPADAGPASASSGDATPAREHVITKRAITGWVLYDLANTIFSMGVISIVFPLWVKDAVGETRADSVYAAISATSMGIIFIVSPLLGAMTDAAPRRMPFLAVSTLICVSLTMVLGYLGFRMSAVCFILANIAYQAGTQYYDSLLPEVSTEENRGRIGGLGVGIGYFGSCIAVTLSLIFAEDKPLLFLLFGAAFLLFSIPCVLFVRERGNPRPRSINFTTMRESAARTISTLRSSRAYPGLLRFLVGRIFYTDPINTIINFMTLFTVNVAVSSGLTKAEGDARAKWIMAFAITFAIAGGFIWGRITDRLGPKRTLNLVLQTWMGVLSLAACVALFGLPLWVMFVVAASAGFSMGGVWAADRPYMLRLTPPGRIGEFYGLYGMVGRFSAITGPVLWGIVLYFAVQKAHLTPLVGQGLAILVLLALMIASYIILRPVSDDVRVWGRDNQTGASENGRAVS